MYVSMYVLDWYKATPTTITFSGTGNATGATENIADVLLGRSLNSKVGDFSLKSDGTRRDESRTSMIGTGTDTTSRRLVILLGIILYYIILYIYASVVRWRNKCWTLTSYVSGMTKSQWNPSNILYSMIDWSTALCANNHKTGNGTCAGRRTVTTLFQQYFCETVTASYGCEQEVSLINSR